MHKNGREIQIFGKNGKNEKVKSGTNGHLSPKNIRSKWKKEGKILQFFSYSIGIIRQARRKERERGRE